MSVHTEATKNPGPCQVRSNTDRPCLHRAVMEIRGVPFCEGCVREQEAYFAVGELVQEVQGLRNEVLVEALDRIRCERTGYTAVAEIEKVKVMLGSQE